MMSYNPPDAPAELGGDFWLRGGAMVNGRLVAIRAVVYTLAVLVVPLRLWTLAAHPGLEIHRLYPVWLQVLTVVSFGGQALSSLRGRDSAILAAVATGVSGAVAAVTGAASFAAGAWVWWVCVAGVEGYTYLQIRQEHRRKAAGDA